jgi:hypothetical protein
VEKAIEPSDRFKSIAVWKFLNNAKNLKADSLKQILGERLLAPDVYEKLASTQIKTRAWAFNSIGVEDRNVIYDKLKIAINNYFSELEEYRPLVNTPDFKLPSGPTFPNVIPAPGSAKPPVVTTAVPVNVPQPVVPAANNNPVPTPAVAPVIPVPPIAAIFESSQQEVLRDTVWPRRRACARRAVYHAGLCC